MGFLASKLVSLSAFQLAHLGACELVTFTSNLCLSLYRNVAIVIKLFMGGLSPASEAPLVSNIAISSLSL